jgi:superoxide dismutase, Cu-Zn family
MQRLVLAALFSLSVSACAHAQDTTHKVDFVDTKGQPAGTAELTESPNGVLVKADLRNVPPGEHAFHLHETGVCDPQSGFRSAGGHYGPGGAQHGYLVEQGPHAGDMPNQFAEESGRLRAEAILPMVTFEGGSAPMFDQDGSALVLHAGVDDYQSQPAGDAGDRIACAVVKRQ